MCNPSLKEFGIIYSEIKIPIIQKNKAILLRIYFAAVLALTGALLLKSCPTSSIDLAFGPKILGLFSISSALNSIFPFSAAILAILVPIWPGWTE